MQSRAIDVCRGIAALWVVCVHHAYTPAFVELLPRVHRILSAGFLGVPMFFVISGYCIAASADGCVRNRERTREFLRRRFLRIYPPFWASLVVVLGAIPFVSFLGYLKSGVYPDYPIDALSQSGMAWLRMVTLTQGFQEGNSFADKFLPFSMVYWTLGVEVQFYLVVAAALRFRSHFRGVLAVVTALSLPFVFLPELRERGPFLPFWPQFALGVLLFGVVKRGWTGSSVLGRGVSRGLAVALAAAVAGGIAIHGDATHLENFPTKTGFALTFAILLWLGLGGESTTPAGSGARRLIGAVCRVGAGLGTVSYSLYLIHAPLSRVTRQVVRQFLREDSIATDAAMIGLVCLLAVPFYFVAERPFISRRAAKRAAGQGGGVN